VTAQLRSLPTTAGVWQVSDSRTVIAFSVGSLGHRVHGSVPLSWGEVELDCTGAPSRVRAEFDLNGLDTGISKRDADLRKPRYLDIDRHPTMTWSADRFTPGADGSWTAVGRLSVRGTSAPLTVTGTAESVALDGEWVRVRASGVLDRTTVGIRAPSFLIGREVRIEIDAWLLRP
jgi:polyisoprenoid-binding protein YceI